MAREDSVWLSSLLIYTRYISELIWHDKITAYFVSRKILSDKIVSDGFKDVLRSFVFIDVFFDNLCCCVDVRFVY